MVIELAWELLNVELGFTEHWEHIELDLDD